MFSVQTKSRKPAFSHSSGVKSVFEKHPFHDGLLWTEGLTVEKQLRFHIFPVKCGRCLISHPMITRCRKCLVLSFIFSLVFTFINCSVSVHDIYSLLLLNKREINRKQRAMNSESARKKHRIRLVTSYFFFTSIWLFFYCINMKLFFYQLLCRPGNVYDLAVWKTPLTLPRPKMSAWGR